MIDHALLTVAFCTILGAGIAPCPNQEEEALFVRVENHEEQSKTKQHLISSYKKNIYPLLKTEIHSNELEDMTRLTSSRSTSRVRTNGE